MKNLCSGTQCGGFQFLLILDLWGVSFHDAVVFGLGLQIKLNDSSNLTSLIIFIVPSKSSIVSPGNPLPTQSPKPTREKTSLIDSGFSMKCVFAGLTCAVIKDDKNKSHIILDADSVTMRKASNIEAQVTFVFESRKKDILASHVTGKCTEEVFQECLRIAKNASDKIFQFYREVVQKKF